MLFIRGIGTQDRNQHTGGNNITRSCRHRGLLLEDLLQTNWPPILTKRIRRTHEIKTLIMKNKILVYDDNCPLCTWYSGLFVKYGFLHTEGRKPSATAWLILTTVFVFKDYQKRMEYAAMSLNNQWMVSIHLLSLTGFILYI